VADIQEMLTMHKTSNPQYTLEERSEQSQDFNLFFMLLSTSAGIFTESPFCTVSVREESGRDLGDTSPGVALFFSMGEREVLKMATFASFCAVVGLSVA